MAETLSQSHKIWIRIDNQSSIDSIEIIAGSKFLIKKDNINYWQLSLEGVRGGYSEFFGIKLNEVDGDREDRIYLYNKSVLIQSYSYEKITKLQSEIIDTIRVYILK
jgi:hypothetical protein